MVLRSLACCRPQQPTSLVIDDEGQVPLALPVADLVDPNPAQAGEQIAVGSRFTGDALLGCSTRSPRPTRPRP